MDIDITIARISAFKNLEDLTSAIEDHGYTPTLRLDPEGDAQHQADVLAVRAELKDRGMRVYPPTLPEELEPTEPEPTEVIRVRGLSGSALFYIGAEAKWVEYPSDHYAEGRTYVETTRRVLEAVLDRISAYEDDIVVGMVSGGYSESDEQQAFAEDSIRHSLAVLTERVESALLGLKPRKVRRGRTLASRAQYWRGRRAEKKIA